jgi:predicted AlkP superfamily phosphohydrolase/phosphomutase
MKAPKITFLGMCAGDRDLIFDWARAGVMPTMARLMNRGLVGLTENIPLFYVQCVWPSFYTSVLPDKHGVHSWQQLKPGTYEQYRAYTPECVQREPFWDVLSRAGRRCAILDVPQSRPSTELNGIQLVEWGAHDANHGFLTSPPELAAEIIDRFGRHPVAGLCDADRSSAQLARFRDDLLRGIAGKEKITEHFLRQGGWDFFAQVFTETHCVGHQCWHLHDPAHPRHSREAVAIAGDPIRDVYVAIDQAIAAVLDHIADDSLVVVYAGHGMGPKYQPVYALAEILIRLGVAIPAIPAPMPTETSDAFARGAVDAALRWAWRRIPASLRQRLRPQREASQEPLRRDIDPSASQCFLIPNNNYGAIRINLIGREPEGRIAPGVELDAFCEQLTRDLMDLVDLTSGRRLVRRVIRTKDIYESPRTTHFPDLLVEWENEAEVTGIASPKIGAIRRGYDYCRTGDHKSGGFFVAVGPGLSAGRLSRSVSIMDFAPTFCDILGVNLPGVDGVPIPELVAATRRSVPV